MANWSRNRQLLYGTGVLLALVVVFGGLAFALFYDAPTCSDGAQNGDEIGVDCGGSCSLICADDTTDPAVLWSRSFPVVSGVYNAVAYVDNANTNAVSDTVGYVFRLYDSRNVLVAERRGSTRIGKTGIVPIFEAGIQTGNRVVARTLFEFTDTTSWQHKRDSLPTLSITQRSLSGENSMPRLDARIENTSLIDAFDTTVIAVVFNQEGNAIAASRTSIPLLEGGAREDIVFTWPEPFSQVASQVDIIPRLRYDD